MVLWKVGKRFCDDMLAERSLPLDTRPTLLGTDNLANFKVATGVGCPTRSRHFLRRYFVLKRRIASGDVTMLHVPDAQMPADCLTKWLGADKVRASVEYMTGKRAQATPSASMAIDLTVINEAIANVTEHLHGDNLLDKTNQVGGCAVGAGKASSKVSVTGGKFPPAVAARRPVRERLGHT